ncbi:MAG: DUF167 domain-containing protein [Clostridiaceae bacterium]|jgi:uncharacterized protein|nr:DUF167 domain-containing protein [Clostridiaceae bacterium]
MKKNDGFIVHIKISPNASKNEIIKSEDGVKVKITAQPVENKANKALVEFLSKEFKIPKTSIEIVKGQTSKEKTLLIKVEDEHKLNAIKMLIM